MSKDIEVFPAYAGVSRRGSRGGWLRWCLPRLRGGEPAAFCDQPSPAVSSPPTRG